LTAPAVFGNASLKGKEKGASRRPALSNFQRVTWSAMLRLIAKLIQKRNSTKLPNAKGITLKADSTASVAASDASPLTQEILNDIRRTVYEMNEIPERFRGAVYLSAADAIRAGRDARRFHIDLISLYIDGVTEKRADEIVRFVLNRATALMVRERLIRMGVTHATWIYSGAPCGSNDADHKAANGKQFRLSKGMTIRGKATFPGYDEGCKCIARPNMAHRE
jgi:hypothetical protein